MKYCWANWVFIVVLAVLSLSSLLSGCGKTGDLYLPDKETEQTK
ncbi:MAG: lipoprotein [Gammaproteobacteria bacterium]|nr:lipoprotein [Gammaproteobacteria bacterium]